MPDLFFCSQPSYFLHHAPPTSIFLKCSGFTGPGTYSAEPGSNGLAVNAQGCLVSCEHGDRRLSLLTKGGGKRTLTDNCGGKRFNSPNDLTIAKNSDVYFTYPLYLTADMHVCLVKLAN